MYNFSTLAPSAAAAKNAKLAAENETALTGQVLGIEVTEPGLAARCSLGNVDPQHTGGNASRAAIEEAVSMDLPPEGATLVTIRADLDSVGAMAVLSIRAQGTSLESAQERIEQVATSDKFARGGYPGPKPLPTRHCPWNEETASSAEGSRPLAAIAAAVMDFKSALAQRVASMEKWLLTGEEPQQYRDSVEKERVDMIAAMESGAIKHEMRADGRIAVVESTHRAATSVGYSLAPVVVARNPAFKFGGGEAHAKYTVCAFEAGKFADIKSALAELATLEPGWGGSPTIGGSPQGVSSTLTIDQVVEVVTKHLK